MTEVLTKEQAQKELTAWLDFKKVRPKQREIFAAQYDVLVEAMQYGDITMDNATYVIKHKLITPVDGLFDSLEYQPRKTVGELQKANTSVNAIDADSKLNGIICCVTGKGLSHLLRMYPEDYVISQAVSVFFMF